MTENIEVSNWLSNRILKSYDDIVDHCCFVWNNLVNQPLRILSIGMMAVGSCVMINACWY
jgi:hypothetical protein